MGPAVQIWEDRRRVLENWKNNLLIETKMKMGLRRWRDLEKNGRGPSGMVAVLGVSEVF